MLKNIRKNKGFTLIEILVVIVIIGILTAIISVSVGDIRKKTRNAKRVSDIRAYAVAFEMAIDKNGGYPDPGDGGYCLGDYGVKGSTEPGDKCGTGYVFESLALNTILKEFIPGLPASEDPVMAYGSSYSGYIYACLTRPSDLCTKVTVRWLMEKSNQSCGVGTVLVPDFDGNTLCFYTTSI